MSLNETPRAERLSIGIFGKRNSGKSSLINALAGHEIAIVSEHAGTTADPVYKSIEIPSLGPCVLIDTAGYDDIGDLGELRVSQSKKAAEKTDISLIVISDFVTDEDMEWFEYFKDKNIPTIVVLNKVDLIENSALKVKVKEIKETFNTNPILVSSQTRKGINTLLNELTRNLPEDFDSKSITQNLVKEGDTVLLVMPQDQQAPKGRLILPQVQTIRELLDKRCIVISSTVDKLEESLKALKNPPSLIITDSQVFKQVYELKPEKSKLTSFSVLFAGYKGDIKYFAESAALLDSLKEDSKILIAEACTHVPQKEDIGRVKIPNMLRQRFGDKITITNVSGNDFPTDIETYDLIIHCGACMFNRRYVLQRIETAKLKKVPMTNYGIVIAYLTGILDKITIE